MDRLCRYELVDRTLSSLFLSPNEHSTALIKAQLVVALLALLTHNRVANISVEIKQVSHLPV